jgi:deazaflavin-dependent oxidoreductase (nitroreductase family)
MANPFKMSPWFHKAGHVTNTMAWRMLPTPNGLGVLTTTGRRTDKRRVRAIRVAREGDRLYAVAMLGKKCGWIYNIRDNPAVRLKLGRRTYDASAREVTGAELGAARVAYLQNAGWFDYFDYMNLMWSFPTQKKLVRAHEEWLETGIPVVFELRT